VNPAPTLPPRTAAVLRAVVTHYIRTAEPVGSSAIAGRYRLRVSPATVRGEMASLEDAGYLTHPHTSAGRIPTDHGYRFYVDSLPARATLPEAHRRAIAAFFGEPPPDVEDVFERTASLLSRLTRYAAIAVAPVLDASRVARADLVEVGGGWLLVAVSDTGRVDKRPLTLPDALGRDEAEALAETVSRTVTGRSYDEASARIDALASRAEGEERRALEALAVAFRDLAGGGAPEHVFVGGVGNIAADAAFERRETLRRLFEALEEREAIYRFLRAAAGSGDVVVRIGAEHPLSAMHEASTVVAAYRSRDRLAGTIAVIGPTRMEYPTAMSAVQMVAFRLSGLIETLAG